MAGWKMSGVKGKSEKYIIAQIFSDSAANRLNQGNLVTYTDRCEVGKY